MPKLIHYLLFRFDAAISIIPRSRAVRGHLQLVMRGGASEPSTLALMAVAALPGLWLMRRA